MDITGIITTSNKLSSSVTLEHKRYLYDRIYWEQPMLCIKGPRGVGKTTLMLQRIREVGVEDTALYVSLDHLWFSEHRLIELVEYHYSHGGTHIFVDEVHRYPYKNWMQEMKNIYDSYPGYHVVFSGSSLLKIDMSIADLSRRCMFYNMQGLSFREYLGFAGIADFKPCTLEEVLNHHGEIARQVNSEIRPLKHFADYIVHGYYPYYEKYAPVYPEIIQQTITAIIDEDLNAVQDIASVTRNKFKRLLYIISQQVPFVPNISNIGQAIESTRKQAYEMISTLERAALINNLYSGKADFSQLTKPEKIYLENTNMMHALSSHVDKGNDRETFFANQLNEGHRLSYTGKGDFLIDGHHTIEVGGKSKGFDQIKDMLGSYIASDDIEYGYGNRIPLWLFGFLY